jgi:hypothetical protein
MIFGKLSKDEKRMENKTHIFCQPKYVSCEFIV